MILPVLDLMHGQIVRGIAGRRDAYRPIVSRLTDSAEPLAVARAFRSHFGFTEFYLADLDAIQHGQPALAIHDQLQQDGFRLWIDAGLCTDGDADRIGATDENGNFVDPHKIFSVLLSWVLRRKGWTGAVTRAFNTTKMLDRIAKKHGRELIEHGIGFKFVCDYMLER